MSNPSKLASMIENALDSQSPVSSSDDFRLKIAACCSACDAPRRRRKASKKGAEKMAMNVVQDYAAKAARGVNVALRSRMKQTHMTNPVTARAPKPMTPPTFRPPAPVKPKMLGMGMAKASSIRAIMPGGGGGGPVPCIEGWGTHLAKDIKDKIDKLKAKMKPGDIVNTDPRKPMGPDRGFKALSKTFQGTRFGHSAMYDGKGHVIEARAHTVIRRPLEDLIRCNEVMVVRPKGVTMADRLRAVREMQKHVGKDGLRVTLGNLVRHGIRPTVISRAHEGQQQQIDRALCSSLIANSYAKVPFNPERSILDHRPSDILKSDKVKVVGSVT